MLCKIFSNCIFRLKLPRNKSFSNQIIRTSCLLKNVFSRSINLSSQGIETRKGLQNPEIARKGQAICQNENVSESVNLKSKPHFSNIADENQHCACLISLNKFLRGLIVISCL